MGKFLGEMREGRSVVNVYLLEGFYKNLIVNCLNSRLEFSS